MLLENSPYPQDVRVRQEAEALARAGYAVTVLAPRADDQPPEEAIGGVQVRRFWLPRSSQTVRGLALEYVVAHLQLLVRSIRELMRDARVLHLHTPPDTLFVIGQITRALGRKVVLDQHDSMPELFEEKFGIRSVGRLLRLVQGASIRTATSVIVTNESQRELASVRAGRPSRKPTVVRNGPYERALSPGTWHRPGPLLDPRIVYVGELGWQDGVLELPQLLRHPRLEEATLTVVGDGPSRDQLLARCDEYGVRERVEWTGWVAYEEVFRHLRQADIAVDPAPCNTLNHISTMMKIGEYLAAARPVVAYRLRETERTAGAAALYARCGDSEDFGRQVVRLAGEAGLRAELSGVGLDRAADLVWEHSEKALLDVYAGL